MAISTTAWTVAGRRLRTAAGTVVGSKYRENYDVLHLDAERPLAVVADGMGDGPGSAIAGRTAVDVFVRHAIAGPSALRSAVAEVQREVLSASRRLPGLTGCTLTAFVGDPAGADSAAWLVQLGDSRAYRVRDGFLELLTADHTAAWLGVLGGWYPPGSREASVDRHRLIRYAGHPRSPEPDLINVSLRPEDLFLLCTDGVPDQIDDRWLGRALTSGAEPAATVETVLARTLARGGDDNATAVVIRVD